MQRYAGSGAGDHHVDASPRQRAAASGQVSRLPSLCEHIRPLQPMQACQRSIVERRSHLTGLITHGNASRSSTLTDMGGIHRRSQRRFSTATSPPSETVECLPGTGIAAMNRIHQAARAMDALLELCATQARTSQGRSNCFPASVQTVNRHCQAVSHDPPDADLPPGRRAIRSHPRMPSPSTPCFGWTTRW